MMTKNTMTSIKTYSELIKLPTFAERFRYLKLTGTVGEPTFGFDRWVNQQFYMSREWLAIRDSVILRDMGFDLGVEGRPISGPIMIHHMNPISKHDILDRTDLLLNPEYLICTCRATHNAIHYGDENILQNELIIRTPNDTCPWRR